MTDILKSQAFNTGTKFIVTEDSIDGTLGPGTTGFISYVKGHDQDFHNVLYLRAVVLRRGKTGRERLNFYDLSTPVFDIKDKELVSKMPDEKRRAYVHIKSVPLCNHIFNMSPIDFLGFGTAWAAWLHKLYSKFGRGRNTLPLIKREPFSSFQHMEDIYNDIGPDEVKARYAPNRDEFVRQIRRIEASLIKCSLSYMQRVAQIEVRAAKALEGTVQSINKDILTATTKNYSKKQKSLTDLRNSKTKSPPVASKPPKALKKTPPVPQEQFWATSLENTAPYDYTYVSTTT